MTYFTSDLHFGHENIIKHCNRPFSTVEEMDEALIENWNRTVHKCDTVYIIGDVVWDKRKVGYYMERLKGKKILIPGNHDEPWAKREEIKVYFSEIEKYMERNLCCHPVTLCHYPLLEWRNSREENERKIGFLIHGHIHNRVSEEYLPLYTNPCALNAGVDLNNYRPVSFEELVENNNAFKVKALRLLGT